MYCTNKYILHGLLPEIHLERIIILYSFLSYTLNQSPTIGAALSANYNVPIMWCVIDGGGGGRGGTVAVIIRGKKHTRYQVSSISPDACALANIRLFLNGTWSVES